MNATGGGDNVIDSGTEDDKVYAGTGSDTISTGEGNDQVSAKGGDNVIDTGDGKDRVTTGSGSDTITTGEGADQVTAKGGDNIIDTGTGNDKVYLGKGSDTITTGEGNDYVRAKGGDNTIDAGEGNDKVVTSSGDDTISGGSGDDYISSSSGNDSIDGGQGDDKIYAGLGNDSITGEEGSNFIDGGKGTDTVSFDGDVFDYSFSMKKGVFTLDDGNGGTDIIKNFENFEFDGKVYSADDINSKIEVESETYGVQGNEDDSISLGMDEGNLANLDKVTISGLPEGSMLTAGTENDDGTWTLHQGELGSVSIIPPADDSSDFTISISGDLQTEGGGSIKTSVDMEIQVDGIADQANLSVSDISVNAGESASLDIQSSLSDFDGPETLSITLTGLDEGMCLNHGTQNEDGSWSLESSDLDGLMVSTPSDLNSDIEIHVEATTMESDSADIATISEDLVIHVEMNEGDNQGGES